MTDQVQYLEMDSLLYPVLISVSQIEFYAVTKAEEVLWHDLEEGRQKARNMERFFSPSFFSVN